MIHIKNGRGPVGNELKNLEVIFRNGYIEAVGDCLQTPAGYEVVDAKGQLLVPAFIDVHVHLREPGLTHKETIKTGARAALKGGYGTIFAMPNVLPMPDEVATLTPLLEKAETDAPIRVGFYGTLSKAEKGEELVDFGTLKAAGAVGFTDDGRGLQSAGLMAQAMEASKQQGFVIAAHCEENSLIGGGYIHKGEYAKAHGHVGIPASCEDVQVARDLLLAQEIGASYHICHMSSGRGVDLLELAQGWGAKVTGEVTPHHLILCDEDLKEDGNFKMNPPLRSRQDRDRLVRGLREGTIGVIATDHAPHSPQEKSKGLAKSPFGIIGTEDAFGLLYTKLVKAGLVDLETIVKALTQGPADVFSLAQGRLEKGAPADISLVDLEKSYVIDPEDFESLSRNTPFAGVRVYGRASHVWSKGKKVLEGGRILE